MQLIQQFPCLGAGRKKIERPVVLVVDDQPSILEMLSWALYLQGYQPACAGGGQEALEWMENALRTGLYPTVILLDLLMPVMSGDKFLTRLRSCWNVSLPIPPVILLTVDKSNHDHLACNDVLLKPFHIKDLHERLSKIVQKKEFAS